MDVFAHSLWTYAAAHAANRKLAEHKRRPINVWWVTFFGVWPDIFAGSVPFVWLAWSFLNGTLTTSDLLRVDIMNHGSPQVASIFGLWSSLYHWSHSLIIFLVVFGLVWLFARRPVWELGGWLLHILIDIPTHSMDFFPTPFLWPLSNAHVNGVPWGETWFMILNYSALLIVLIIMFHSKNPRVKGF